MLDAAAELGTAHLLPVDEDISVVAVNNLDIRAVVAGSLAAVLFTVVSVVLALARRLYGTERLLDERKKRQ